MDKSTKKLRHRFTKIIVAQIHSRKSARHETNVSMVRGHITNLYIDKKIIVFFIYKIDIKNPAKKWL